jgi:hypothetical protein
MALQLVCSSKGGNVTSSASHLTTGIAAGLITRAASKEEFNFGTNPTVAISNYAAGSFQLWHVPRVLMTEATKQ